MTLARELAALASTAVDVRLEGIRRPNGRQRWAIYCAGLGRWLFATTPLAAVRAARRALGSAKK